MNIIIRFLFPVVVLLGVGFYVSHNFAGFGESMAQKTVAGGIASQIRYHQGTIKDGETCFDFRERIGKVSSSTTTGEALPQLLALSNEARAAGCLK
jgi:hypothetical protein